MIIKQLLNKSGLNHEEMNLLVGEICASYERLRFCGTEQQVMKIYESDKTGDEDNYIREKTGKYFRCGDGFAAHLNPHYLINLGEILRENVQ